VAKGGKSFDLSLACGHPLRSHNTNFAVQESVKGRALASEPLVIAVGKKEPGSGRGSSDPGSVVPPHGGGIGSGGSNGVVT
jgi:hypothetical protein